MANRVRDSFDFYGAISEAVGLWTTLGGASSLTATTRFGVGQALVTGTIGGNITMSASFGVNIGTIFLTFAMSQPSALASAVQTQAFRLYDAGTVQCSIIFNRNGNIEFYRGDSGTLLGTYSGAFAGSGAWAHYQIKVVISNTVGEFHVRKNGNTADDFAVTGVDNSSNANEFCNAMDMICKNTAANPLSFDDVWVFDTTASGGEPVTWIGDVRAVQLMPSSDSTIQLTRSGGASNFAAVNELISSAALFVFGSSAPLTDEYGNAGLATTPAAILGVTVKSICFKSDAGARTAGLRIHSGATTVDSAGVAIGTVAQTIAMNQDLDPNTSAAWTAVNLAAMLHGPRIVT